MAAAATGATAGGGEAPDAAVPVKTESACLRPGVLREMVVTYVREHSDQDLSPSALAAQGSTVEVCTAKPRAIALTPNIPSVRLALNMSRTPRTTIDRARRLRRLRPPSRITVPVRPILRLAPPVGVP